MSQNDGELERLLKAEQDACDRNERLSAPQSSLRDEAMLKAARELCDDARNAVERYREQHPQERRKAP